MSDLNAILKWANENQLSAGYKEARDLLFHGVHPGFKSSLPIHSRPLDQLWSDVSALQSAGPIVGGEVPYRTWLANLARWAERGGRPIAGLQAVMAAAGLDVEPVAVAGAVPAAPAAAPIAAPIADPIADPIVRVLFVSANVVETRLLGIDRELNQVQTLVDATTHRDRFALSTMPDIDITQVAHQLQKVRPKVLHFSGHGTDEGALIMRGPSGGHLPIKPDGLAKLLGILGDSLKLIVLNACFSDALSQKIVAQMDVVVLGMTRLVQDATALQYARGLYQTLFHGATIREAHDAAAAILAAMGQVDAEAPLLRMRAGSTLADRPIWG